MAKSELPDTGNDQQQLQTNLLDAIEAASKPVERELAELSTAHTLRGVAQLSVIECALCPLDDAACQHDNFVHDTYFLRYPNGRAVKVPVEVRAAYGFSASDEYLMLGLLSLVCNDQQEGHTYWATPHYVLRRLGLSNDSKGGKNYRQFRKMMKRIGALSVFCKEFYDPVIGDYREELLRFVRASMPADPSSQRAYKFVFDPALLDVLRDKAGALHYDWPTFKDLGKAERRAFLVLSKIYHKRRSSPQWNVRYFGINVLGYSDKLSTADLKIKMQRVVKNLAAKGIVELDAATGVKGIFTKGKKRGDWWLRLHRGSYFDAVRKERAQVVGWRDNALYEPLKAIGFVDRDIRWFIGNAKHEQVALWADVTLCAMEAKSKQVPKLKGDPQAYFRHYLKMQSDGAIASAPDWYHELKKIEEQQQSSGVSYTELLEQRREQYELAKLAAIDKLIANDRPGYNERVAAHLSLTKARGDRITEQARKAATEAARGFYEAKLNYPPLERWQTDYDAAA